MTAKTSDAIRAARAAAFRQPDHGEKLEAEKRRLVKEATKLYAQHDAGEITKEQGATAMAEIQKQAAQYGYKIVPFGKFPPVLNMMAVPIELDEEDKRRIGK